MARTDDQVGEILLDIYKANFGGRERQRYLISWQDLRGLYGFGRLTMSRLDRLVEVSLRKRLYLLDLGEGDNGHQVAVIKSRTVDKWRKVPKRIIEQYTLPTEEDAEDDDDDVE